jgi:cobaltochelatase CobT
MGGNRIRTAMQAVVLFLETLKATSIKAEVLGYTTGPSQHWYSDGMELSFGACPYGRVEQLLTYVIKDFNEPYNAKIKRRISNYGDVRLKENCDPENVKIAYDRLRQRPEKRKILFVLSDGAVCNHGNAIVGRQYYKELVEKIEREGVVEPIGIGFFSGSIKQYYKKWIIVRSAGSELAKELLEQLRKIFRV